MKRGFTLIEVLVAVSILGLVAAGSLKLAITSQVALQETIKQHVFLGVVKDVQTGLMSGKLEDNGVSGDIRWDRKWVKRERKNEPVTEWSEVEVSVPGRKMTVCVP